MTRKLHEPEKQQEQPQYSPNISPVHFENQQLPYTQPPYPPHNIQPIYSSLNIHPPTIIQRPIPQYAPPSHPSHPSYPNPPNL